MRKFKIFAFLGILFSSLFMFIGLTNVKADTTTYSTDATVDIDGEINAGKTEIRFIITATGVELKNYDTIELVLKKNGEDTKQQIFISTVYTSITGASREYAEADNTYYGVVAITEINNLVGCTISANCIITYTDASTKTMDAAKEFEIPYNDTLTRVGDVVYFGDYPQTKVTDEDVISSLNTLAGTPSSPTSNCTWNDYNYYISNVKANYMYYTDIDLNNDGSYEYRGVYFSQYRPYTINSESSADNTFQDDNGYSTNTAYWFKYEKLKWNILSIQNGKAYIGSEMLLDSQQYAYSNNKSSDAENHNGYTARYYNNYEASDIRIWLNDTFYNTAFDTNEKGLINTMTVDNSINTVGSVEKALIEASSLDQASLFSGYTSDKVTLLSFEEANTFYSSATQRQFYSTDYCNVQGFRLNSTGYGDNWLRSPSRNPYDASYITRSGNIINSDRNYSYDTQATLGLRPTMLVDLDMVTLNVSVNDANLGSVNVDAETIRAEGETINLVATCADDGYSFIGWYNGTELVSSNKEYTLTMPATDYNLEARFDVFTLTTAIDDANAGSVTEYNAEAIKEGTLVDVTITLNDGYSFEGWYNGTECVSTYESYPFYMPSESLSLVAKTAQYTFSSYYIMTTGSDTQYKITFESNGGTTYIPQYSNNLVYPGNPTKDGYAFAGWYSDEACTQGFDFTSTITKDITLYAKWVETDENHIRLNPGDCEDTYVAELETSKTFVVTATYTGTMNLRVYSSGERNRFHIYVYNSNNEEIKNIYNDRVTSVYDISIDVQVGETYYINEYIDEKYSGYSGTSTFQFQVTYYEMEVEQTGYDYATATYNDAVFKKAGTNVSLQATINTGTTFLGWYNGDELLTTSPSYGFMMPHSDICYVAKFAYYTLTTTTNIEGAGTYSSYTNEKVTDTFYTTLFASPEDGYAFLGWYIGDTLMSESLEYKYQQTRENVVIEARFIGISVTLTKNIDEAGTVSCPTEKVLNEEITITATVNYGYIFTGWYDADGNKVSSTLTYTFTLTGDSTYEAKYIESNISINITYDEAGTLSDYEFGYILGDTLEVTVTYESNYTWCGWYLNNEYLTDEYTITIDITDETKAYVAKFEKYVLTLTSNYDSVFEDIATITYDSNGGSEVASQTSDNISYVYPTKSGYVFAGWYNDSELTEEHDFTSAITGNITLYAKWIENEKTPIIVNKSISGVIRAMNVYTDPYSVAYAFYAFQDDNLTFTVSDYTGYYGLVLNILDADKNQIASASDNSHVSTLSVSFDVTKGQIYYIAGRRISSDVATYNAKFTLTGNDHAVTYETTSTDTIIKSGDTVNIVAVGKAGYTFSGWYLNDELVSTTTNYTFVMPAASVEYEAKYTKAEINYTVNHYQQNADDDDYTLYETETLSGLVDETTAAAAKNYVDYVVQAFEQTTIAGDGSTVINIYYIRNKYTLTVTVENDHNDTVPGSVNVTSADYKVAQNVSLVATVNDGYEFVGWYYGTKKVCETEAYQFVMPSKALSLTAKYTALEVAYTVNYYLENLDNDEYTLDSTVNPNGYTGDVTSAEEKAYTGFTMQAFDQGSIASDGSTVINIYYDRVVISKVALEIYYDSYDGNKYGEIDDLEGFSLWSISPQGQSTRYYLYATNVKYGYSVTPTITTETGYTLEGWYLNNADRITNSELSGFTYVVDSADVVNDEIWLIAKVTCEYAVNCYYQNNVDAWVNDGADRTYTLDSDTSFTKTGIVLDTTDVTEAEITIKDGYEILEIVNAEITDTSSCVNVYLVPLKYQLSFDRKYEYIEFPTYDGAMAPSTNSDQYVELYYGQTSKVIATGDSETENVTFVGWFVDKDGYLVGDAVSTELSFTYTMTNSNVVLVPVFEATYTKKVYYDDDSTPVVSTGTGYVGYQVTAEVIEGYTFNYYRIYNGSTSAVIYKLGVDSIVEFYYRTTE